jgi:PDZ domain
LLVLLLQGGGERELRLRISGKWHRSASFPVDGAGEYTLRLRRRHQWQSLQHVSTRDAAEYCVRVPPGEPGGELGLWLETDWYRRQAVVKEVRKDGFMYKHTDVQVGDVLLAVNDTDTAGMRFDDVVAALRAAAGSADGAVLQFRTMEERYRLLRDRAMGRKARRAGSTTAAAAAGGVDGAAAADPFAHRSQHSRGAGDSPQQQQMSFALPPPLPPSQLLTRGVPSPAAADWRSDPEDYTGLSATAAAAASAAGSRHSRRLHSRGRSQSTDGGYDTETGGGGAGGAAGRNGGAASDDEFEDYWDDMMDAEAAGNGSSDAAGIVGAAAGAGEQEVYIKVELRPMAASTVLVVSKLEPERTPYVIENIDIESRVYFRQK